MALVCRSYILLLWKLLAKELSHSNRYLPASTAVKGPGKTSAFPYRAILSVYSRSTISGLVDHKLHLQSTPHHLTPALGISAHLTFKRKRLVLMFSATYFTYKRNGDGFSLSPLLTDLTRLAFG